MFAKRYVSIGTWKRFKSTIPKCPEPAIDTGCTFCTPDPALFDKRGLEDPLPPSPLHYKHLILPTGTIGL